ncbi:hypothetical protein, partial [Bacillus sp. SM2101]|uniref:hypothetical protein n=1 Tax=Bacillus sp. SM2101 TaxID=2805366 RepID=UPI001BDDECCB
GLILGLAILSVLGFTIFKIITGKEVEFNEFLAFSSLFMMFFSAITWGGEKDGILQNEELGRKITEQSSKISYYILVVIIMIFVFLGYSLNGTYIFFILGIMVWLLFCYR